MTAAATEGSAASARLDARTWALIAATLGLALAVQGAIFASGFHSSAADESARALTAANLTFTNAFDPQIWPPLYRWVVGLALFAHDDLFLTPRLIAQGGGLLTILAVAVLARELFASRLVALLAAVLSVFLNHRLIFAVAPMSEMLFNPLMVLAFAGFARVVRAHSPAAILVTSGLLALAAMARYEAWFVSAAFGGYLFWRFLSGRVGFGVLAAAGAILSAFPVLWLANAALNHGGIGDLFITSAQARASGAGWKEAVLWGHAFRYARDILETPLIVALAPMIGLSVQDGRIRTFCAGLLGSIALVSAISIATGSVAYAVNWRLSGAWTLATLPFVARFIVALGDAASGRFRTLAVAAATAAVTLGVALKTFEQVTEFARNPEFSRADLAAGRFIGTWLAAHDGERALVEAEDFGYLNLMVGSNAPERVIASTGDDPLKVALYIETAEYWRRTDPKLYAAYAAPKYDLARGGDEALLAGRGVGLVIVKNPNYAAAIAAAGRFRKIGAFGPWTAFEKPPR